MKKIITFLFLFFIGANFLFAQWSKDYENNLLVSKRGVLGQDHVKAKMTSDGKIYVLWVEWVKGPYTPVEDPDLGTLPSANIRLQLLDKDGNMIWNEPMLVSGLPDNPSTSWTTDIALDVTPDGCAIVAFSDTRTDQKTYNDFKPYIYKIDQEQNQLWGLNGIAIPSTSNRAYRPRIGVTKTGSVFVGYSDVTNGEFNIQRIKEDSDQPTCAWSDNIKLGGIMGQFVPCDEDDIMVVWFGGGITAQRYDIFGEKQWSEATIIESGNFNPYAEPVVIADGYDGAVVSYTQYPSEREQYFVLQRIDADGTSTMGKNPLRPGNEAVKEAVGSFGVGPEKEQIVAFWGIFNGETTRLMANKIGYYSEKLWGENGIEIASNGQFGYIPVLGRVLPDESSILIYIDNILDGQAQNLTVHKLDADGVTQWKQVIGIDCHINSFPPVIFTEDQAYLFWADDRNMPDATGAGEVYGQNIIYNDPASIETAQLNNESIYYDMTTKALNVKSENKATVYVYDNFGALVENLQVVEGENTFSVNLPKGTYIVRLVQNGMCTSIKMFVK